MTASRSRVSSPASAPTNAAEVMMRSPRNDPDTSMTNGDNVFEVHSTSTALALDGKTHYNEW